MHAVDQPEAEFLQSYKTSSSLPSSLPLPLLLSIGEGGGGGYYNTLHSTNMRADRSTFSASSSFVSIPSSNASPPPLPLFQNYLRLRLHNHRCLTAHSSFLSASYTHIGLSGNI